MLIETEHLSGGSEQNMAYLFTKAFTCGRRVIILLDEVSDNRIVHFYSFFKKKGGHISGTFSGILRILANF